MKGLRFENPEKQCRFEAIDLQLVSLQYQEIESIAKGLECDTVLCHCDLLAGNILTPKEVQLAPFMLWLSFPAVKKF